MGRGRTRGKESAVHQRSVVCMWPYLCRISLKVRPHQSKDIRGRSGGQQGRTERISQKQYPSEVGGPQTTEFQQIEKPPKKVLENTALGLQSHTFHWYKLVFWRATVVSKLIGGKYHKGQVFPPFWFITAFFFFVFVFFFCFFFFFKPFLYFLAQLYVLPSLFSHQSLFWMETKPCTMQLMASSFPT